MLKNIFFPGVPYPFALIWHLILGGFAFSLVAAIFGFRGDFDGVWRWWQLFLTQAAVLVAGFLVWRKLNANRKRVAEIDRLLAANGGYNLSTVEIDHLKAERATLV